MPTDRVWWVDQQNGNDMTGDGSQDTPFENVSAALAMVGNGELGTVLLATPTVHLEQIDILAGRTIALLGAQDGARIQFQDAEVVSVGSGGALFAANVEVSQGTAGVFCTGGKIWLDRVWVVNNSGMEPLTDGGIVMSSGEAVVRNSFVGGVTNAEAGLKVNQATVEVLYSTLATGIDAPALECLSGGDTLTVRNSIVVSRMPTSSVVGCDSAAISGSALEEFLPGNVQLPEMTDNSWFEAFNNGNFHLTPSAPAELASAAVWNEGDIGYDIDLDLRPTVDGAADYAGADLIP